MKDDISDGCLISNSQKTFFVTSHLIYRTVYACISVATQFKLRQINQHYVFPASSCVPVSFTLGRLQWHFLNMKVLVRVLLIAW